MGLVTNHNGDDRMDGTRDMNSNELRGPLYVSH